ncbi:MAG: adenosylcobinamide-GDP ribazoletransferase [Candidatus Omnitrophica bacterium]|nr:adenosylcobinamide-GDP ribazoletransferase [Candidatus Omnitrophota bacterium]MCM8826444.1 adenosylcobinamide-GDP ribazoletransferase [Candidatus Omnitrophota bacterium]
MKHFLIALQFLTILPVKINEEIKEEDLANSLLYFPLIGVIIGGILSTILLSHKFLSMPVLSAIILLVSTIISGGLHLDGFADTCDGFCGARSKEKILKIMHDSRIGAFGAIGVVLLLLLKFSLFVSLPINTLWKALIVSFCFARYSQTVCCLLPYASCEGKAKAFVKYARKRNIIIGGIFTLIVFGILLGLKGITIFFVSFILNLIFIFYVKSRISGITGDTIGAVNEIAEVSTLFLIHLLSEKWS